MTDEQLIAAAIAGDEAAYRHLMERYVPLVAGYFVGKAELSATEDLVQDVFISAFNSIHAVRSPALGPWLLGIARHKLHDHYRGRAAQARLEQALLARGNGRPPLTASGPAAHAQASQLEAITLQALGELRETHRLVLYLRLFEELPYAEIAQRLALREVTVRLRARRGLALLRKKLQRRGIAPTPGGQAGSPTPGGQAYPRAGSPGPRGQAYPQAGSSQDTEPTHET